MYNPCGNKNFIYLHPGFPPNEIRIGDFGWIVLAEQSASTGFVWTLIPDNSDAYKIVVNFNLHSSTMPGAPGKDFWIIEPIKKGLEVVILEYKRPWSQEVSKTKNYYLNICP